MSKRVMCGNAEVAGFIQSEIDRQGLSGELEAMLHPYMPASLVAIVADGKPRVFPLEALTAARAGLRVLLGP